MCTFKFLCVRLLYKRYFCFVFVFVWILLNGLIFLVITETLFLAAVSLASCSSSSPIYLVEIRFFFLVVCSLFVLGFFLKVGF